MNRISTYGCLLSVFIIVGCGSDNNDNDSVMTGAANDDDSVMTGAANDDDSVMTGAASELQGTFVDSCEVDDGDSSQERLDISGSDAVFSLITFVNNSTCGGDLTITTTTNATFSIDGTQTQLVDGTANNIDFIITGGSITGSPAVLAELESQGTTLAAVLAAQGITGDLNDLSLADLGLDQAEGFDIFRIDTTADGTDRLNFGNTDGSFTGDTPALRPIELDPDPDNALLRVS